MSWSTMINTRMMHYCNSSRAAGSREHCITSFMSLKVSDQVKAEAVQYDPHFQWLYQKTICRHLRGSVSVYDAVPFRRVTVYVVSGIVTTSQRW